MRDERRALVPTKEMLVDFYADKIVTALVEIEGQTEVFVPLRPLCEHLGLRWSGQFERLQRDPVLSEALRMIRIEHKNRAGDPEVLALPLEYLPGWLFGISTSRVKPELQDKITRYRRECFRVLWRAFQADALRAVGEPQTTVPVRANPSGSLAQIREMGLAIAQMAEQQIALEQRVSTHDTRIDRAAVVIKELQRRIGVVEERVEPAAYITEREAAEVSAQVKALADFLSGKETGKNHYQAIFAELYRRFGVSSYKLIRRGDYEAVLRFLDEWRRATD